MHEIFSILSTLISIEVLLILVRVLISWFPDINPWHPAVRALRTVVDPVLYPFRRIMPTFGGIDLSPILAIIVLDQLRVVCDQAAQNVVPSATFFIVEVLRQLILDVVIAFIIIIVLRLLVGFFSADPWHPTVRLIRDLSTPVVRPFAVFAPRSRSVDSPALIALVVLIVAFFVLRRLLDELLLHTF